MPKHYNGSAALFSNTTYTYDAADRLTVQNENASPRTFTYDTTDQLTADSSNTYTYDANGNRNNGSYTVGTGNQITNDGTWTFTYDNAGSLTKQSKGAALETWTLEYDHDFHVTRIEKRATDGGTLLLRVDFTYDAFGNALTRIEYDGSLNVVSSARFGYDGWKTDSGQHGFIGLENFDVWADLDVSNNLVDRRLFGISIDSQIARISSTGTIAYYVADYHNTVCYMTDGSGTVQATVTYDGYGNILSNSNPGFTDRFGFQGVEFEVTIGFHRFGDRIVLALIFRFTTPDRIGFAAGDPNTSRYGNNGPTNARDPSGNFLLVGPDGGVAWQNYLAKFGIDWIPKQLPSGWWYIYIPPSQRANLQRLCDSYAGGDAALSAKLFTAAWGPLGDDLYVDLNLGHRFAPISEDDHSAILHLKGVILGFSYTGTQQYQDYRAAFYEGIGEGAKNILIGAKDTVVEVAKVTADVAITLTVRAPQVVKNELYGQDNPVILLPAFSDTVKGFEQTSTQGGSAQYLGLTALSAATLGISNLVQGAIHFGETGDAAPFSKAAGGFALNVLLLKATGVANEPILLRNPTKPKNVPVANLVPPELTRFEAAAIEKTLAEMRAKGSFDCENAATTLHRELMNSGGTPRMFTEPSHQVYIIDGKVFDLTASTQRYFNTKNIKEYIKQNSLEEMVDKGIFTIADHLKLMNEVHNERGSSLLTPADYFVPQKK